jgi:hypothetical protein
MSGRPVGAAGPAEYMLPSRSTMPYGVDRQPGNPDSARDDAVLLLRASRAAPWPGVVVVHDFTGMSHDPGRLVGGGFVAVARTCTTGGAGSACLRTIMRGLGQRRGRSSVGGAGSPHKPFTRGPSSRAWESFGPSLLL